MAGTNDIAGNTGPMTLEETQANITSMTELAQANGIAVILGAVPPAAAFPWRPGLETAERIRTLNRWLRAYATGVGATFADYTAVLDDGRGGMKLGFADDGVHPTAAGYAAMAPVTAAAIARALRRHAVTPRSSPAPTFGGREPLMPAEGPQVGANPTSGPGAAWP